ncbi:hypothetical protein RHECIAT_CH0003835 [Rhizobium etli CIAT 652]|uniref:Uncharacterized protein n=1 Tax=Rhizobium etli (strain CIAT 652) TaxID=491916 RepID=B3PZX3_RHIE6|nr:hypothetical protein RHECIAT_CH0003835 [Rhizobium etli CIAT 652]
MTARKAGTDGEPASDHNEKPASISERRSRFRSLKTTSRKCTQMRCNNVTSESQAPRVLTHPGPFETAPWIAYAAMAICNNNGIKTVTLKRGDRVPLEASVIFVTDRTPESLVQEVREFEPTYTIFAGQSVSLSDYMPALISAVRNNRHAAIVVTRTDRLDHWLSIAGRDLVHVAVADPIGFFGDAMGGAE